MSPPSAIEVEAVTDTSGVTLLPLFSFPLASNEIYGRRRKTEKRHWGTAAPSDSANFRQGSYEGKPKAKRWDRKSVHNSPF
jgi:aromatic amino acid aminotransferase I